MGGRAGIRILQKRIGNKPPRQDRRYRTLAAWCLCIGKRLISRVRRCHRKFEKVNATLPWNSCAENTVSRHIFNIYRRLVRRNETFIHALALTSRGATETSVVDSGTCCFEGIRSVVSALSCSKTLLVGSNEFFLNMELALVDSHTTTKISEKNKS
jgi:hypothetical protein